MGGMRPKMYAKNSLESKDSTDSYNRSKNAYKPYHADKNVLNKYKNPMRKAESSDSDFGQSKVQTKTKQKKERNASNDSWDNAWDDDKKVDNDQFQTYKKPTQTSQPVQNVQKQNQPKQENLLDDDLFNFNEMKQEIRQPEQQIPGFDENESSDESDNGKNYQYDFNQYSNAPQQNVSQQNNQNVNQNSNQDEFDFFNNANAGPQAPAPNQTSDLDDIFGNSNNQQQVQLQQPQHQTQQPQSHSQSQSNMFAADPTSIFNTGAPMNNYNYSNYNQPNTNTYNNNNNYNQPSQSYSNPNDFATGII